MRNPTTRTSWFRRISLLVPTLAVTLTTLGAVSPAQATTSPHAAAKKAVCLNFSQTVSMTAEVTLEGLLYTQRWPSDSVTVGTAPCTVTVTRPGGRIDLLGATGDPWKVSIPAGSQMASVSIANVAAPNCTISGAGGSAVANRPSCSLAVSFTEQSGSTAQMTFDAVANPVLTVTKTGTGTGLVSSSPAGISCGSTCEAQYAKNTVVTLSRTAAAGSHFQSWGGACTGGGATCSVTLDQARSVTANFALDDVATLSISKGGAGAGTVTSSPAGINCGPTNSPTCSTNFASGTIVVLTATPASGSTFAGWAGSGCTGTGTCQVTMDANRNVVANFSPTPVPTALTVAKSGSGSGTVTSSPAGIDCGSTCTADFDSGSTVTLSAAPDSGSTFSGWSGGGCSGTGACDVTIAAATTVTATFTSTPATYRPDGLVGIGTKAMVGDKIYNTTGAKQTKAATAKRGASTSFRWVIQNDGNATDTMRLSRTVKSGSGVTVTYKVGGKNVTSKVNSGKYTKAVAAGGSLTVAVTVKVKRTAKTGSTATLLLRATSGKASSVADVVGAKVTAKK